MRWSQISFTFLQESLDFILSQLDPLLGNLNIRGRVGCLLFGLITAINCSQGAFQEERMMDRLHPQAQIHCHGEQKSGRREAAEDRVRGDLGAALPGKRKMNAPIVAAPCVSLVISVTGP